MSSFALLTKCKLFWDYAWTSNCFFMFNVKLKTNQQWLCAVGNEIHSLYAQEPTPLEAEKIVYQPQWSCQLLKNTPFYISACRRLGIFFFFLTAYCIKLCLGLCTGKVKTFFTEQIARADCEPRCHHQTWLVWGLGFVKWFCSLVATCHTKQVGSYFGTLLMKVNRISSISGL